MKKILITLILISAYVSAHGAGYQVNKIPWSGHWWPMNTGELVQSVYQHEPAPVQKYDYVREGRLNGAAFSASYSRYFRPDAVSFGGFCNNWASAAILESEPTSAGWYGGQFFRVGDKKALLTILHDVFYYDRISIDSPLDMHMVLEEYIKKQKRAFMVDVGLNGEVWNYPVYKYETFETRSGNQISYKTKVYMVDNSVPVDFVGTRDLVFTYSYTFVVDDGYIVSSFWNLDSDPNIPKYATFPIAIRTWNENFDEDLIRRIVESNEDLYQGNTSEDLATVLLSGEHFIQAQGERYFFLDVHKGHELNLELYSKNHRQLYLEFTDPQDEHLFTLPANDPIKYFPSFSGRLSVKLYTVGDHFDNVAKVIFYHKKNHTRLIPYFEDEPWSNGLLWSAGQDDRVLTLVNPRGKTADGLSIGNNRFLGFVEDVLRPEHNSFVFLDAAEYQALCDINFLSDSAMIGCGGLPTDNAASTLFVPELVSAQGLNKAVSLFNVGDEPVLVTLKFYDTQGNILKQDAYQHNRFAKKVITPAAYGIYSPCSMEASADQEVLVGALLVRSGRVSEDQGLAALTPPATDQVLSYAANSASWKTQVVLGNVAARTNSLEVVARDQWGTIVGSKKVELEGGGFISWTAHELFGQEAGNLSISVRSTYPVASYAYSFDDQHLCATEFVLQGQQKVLLPHIVAYDQWWTGINIYNPSARHQTIKIKSLDNDNNVIDEQEHSLLPHGSICDMAQNLMANGSRAPEVMYMEIEGQDSAGIMATVVIGSGEMNRAVMHVY